MARDTNLDRGQSAGTVADDSASLSSRVKVEMGKGAKDFRRSRRVIFDMPVDVYISRENEDPQLETAKTLTVNAHGALLALTTPVAFGEILRLINPRTHQEIDCRVRRFAMRYPSGMTQVGVEFAAAAPTFWDVPSAPPDWDPAWIPPSERMHMEGSASPLEVSELETRAGTIEGADRATASGCEPIPRRSGRLAVEIPVLLYSHEENSAPSCIEGRTFSINENGAFLAVAEALYIGQSLLLINHNSRNEIVCHVRSVVWSADHVNHVGVEFATASPNFWGVTFPADDGDASERNTPQQPVPVNATPEQFLENLAINLETLKLDTQLPSRSDIKRETPAAVATSAIARENKSNGRRSNRLALEMPVTVQAEDENQKASFTEGKTVDINVNGGLLAIPATLSIGQSLRLTNSKTRKEIRCLVRSLRENGPGINHVGVEFETASPRFWGVNFLPDNWDEAELKHPQRPLPVKAAPRKMSLPESAVPPFTNLQKIIDEAQREQRESLKTGKAKPKPRGWRDFKWPIVALATCVALFSLWIVVRESRKGSSAVLQNTAPEGTAPADAGTIPQQEGSRLAKVEDFDADAVSWLRSTGQEVSGEISGAFASAGQSQAQVLVGKDGMWRIVILADGKLRCDAKYRSVAIVARVPKQALQDIVWANPPPAGSEGDGLLVVRTANDLGSGVVLLLQGDHVVSGTPSSYQQIPLSQLP